MKKGPHLAAEIKKNIKNKLVPHIDQAFLMKRFLIETDFGQLKTSASMAKHGAQNDAII